jgi:hypothetical protein
MSTEQNLRDKITKLQHRQYNMVNAHQWATIAGVECDDEFQTLLRGLSSGEEPVLERWATFFGDDEKGLDAFDVDQENLDMLDETGTVVHPDIGEVIKDPGIVIYYAMRAPEPASGACGP